MTKAEALALLDAHKNELLDPVEMLRWTWLRVIINAMPEDIWDDAVDKAVEVLAR